MRKNNWFNRIFYKSEIILNQADAELQTSLYANKDRILKQLNECKTLNEVLEFHKKIWVIGYCNDNIGPCEFGMFRTKSIATMKPEEVYLGGIWGLFTNNIPFWEEHRNDKYGYNGYGLDPDQSLYKMILNQYKRQLQSNILEICDKVKETIGEYITAGYECSYSN